jgi:hypothetical protein
MKAWWLILTVVAGCTGAGQALDYARLGIRSESAEAEPGATPQAKCVVLPVLLGSIVHDTLTLEPGLTLQVYATRDLATVRSQGARGGDERWEASYDQLQAGYSEQSELSGPSGSTYLVRLSSDCE